MNIQTSCAYSHVINTLIHAKFGKLTNKFKALSVFCSMKGIRGQGKRLYRETCTWKDFFSKDKFKCINVSWKRRQSLQLYISTFHGTSMNTKMYLRKPSVWQNEKFKHFLVNLLKVVVRVQLIKHTVHCRYIGHF